MINPFQEINWRPDEKAVFSFGRTVCAGLAIIAALFFLVGLNRGSVIDAASTPLWFLVIGMATFFICAAAPKAALPLYYIWFFIAACAGIIISNALLILFYYGFFTPIALALRIITERDPLRLKKPKNASSYWVDHQQRKDVNRYLRQY